MAHIWAGSFSRRQATSPISPKPPFSPCPSSKCPQQIAAQRLPLSANPGTAWWALPGLPSPLDGWGPHAPPETSQTQGEAVGRDLKKQKELRHRGTCTRIRCLPLTNSTRVPRWDTSPTDLLAHSGCSGSRAWAYSYTQQGQGHYPPTSGPVPHWGQNGSPDGHPPTLACRDSVTREGQGGGLRRRRGSKRSVAK